MFKCVEEHAVKLLNVLLLKYFLSSPLKAFGEVASIDIEWILGLESGE